ncbi:MAG: tetratricopeptide repeat protein [Bacillota bacterium]|nr:tetratricopeptide repeat protein [Bacillota bacterium]
MECFEFLGIEPTKDAKVIRNAYSKLLTKFSPENDPEGFQKLRDFYEQAIKYSKEKEEKSLSPIDSFMEDFKAIYNCYEKRLDLESWKAILDRDICCNIDSSKEVSYKILEFLMNDYNITYEVWNLFDSYFSWTSKKERLYESFAKNFIDFVMYKIGSKGSFHYEELIKCENGKQDEFISEYNKASSALEGFDLYTVKTSIDAMMKICPDSIDFIILRGRYFIEKGSHNEAESLFKNLLESHIDDLNAYFFLGSIYLKQSRLEESYENFKNALSCKPESVGTLYYLGKCSLCLDKFEDTIEYLEKFGDLNEYDNETKNMLTSAYKFSVDKLRSEVKGNPENGDLQYKLAKILLRIEKTDESLEVLNELKQKGEFNEKMYHLLCQVLLCLNKKELAYNTILESLEKYPDNYELNFYKASILDDLEKYDEALVQYNKVISINEKASVPYNNKSFVLSKLKRYNEALECAEKAIELDPHMSYAYKNKAEALLKLELYEECLSACEKSLEINQYMTEAYIIKMKALINVRLYDNALYVFNKASELGITDSRLYCEKAVVFRLMRKYDDSIELCDTAINNDEKNGDAYYCKGLCYYSKKNYNEALALFNKSIEYKCSIENIANYYVAQCNIFLEKPEEALEVINKSLELYDEGLDNFYALKGQILRNESKLKEALEEYKNAIDADSNFAGYYYSAGSVLNSMKEYKEASEYLKKAVEMDPSVSNHFIALSYSHYCLKNYHKCIEVCDDALKSFPDSAAAYENKGWALYKMKRLNEAEENCTAALKLDGNNEDVLCLKLNILKQKELYDEALIVIDRILEINPENKSVINDKSDIIQKKKKKKGFLSSLFS